MCEQFVEITSTEPKCLFYGFSFDGDTVHCREGYQDAEGALAHLENVEEELAKLREPLAEMTPQFFTLEYGFRR
jgi:hypothetical protein